MSLLTTNEKNEKILCYGGEQPQGETRKKAFRVADTEIGVMAVARALGFGWSDVRQEDVESAKYADYGISFKPFRHSYKPKFSQPVILMAEQTLGYREISDSLRHSCYKDTVITYDDWDSEAQCGDTWTVDVYRLRPGMEDGWILVQSYSSGATVKAEKQGSAWLITLNMPILEDGKCTGHCYEAKFASAKAWYREQLKNC